jgi:hypothetical protein
MRRGNWDSSLFQNMDYPAIVQEFINHNGVLLKVGNLPHFAMSKKKRILRLLFETGSCHRASCDCERTTVHSKLIPDVRSNPTMPLPSFSLYHHVLCSVFRTCDNFTFDSQKEYPQIQRGGRWRRVVCTCTLLPRGIMNLVVVCHALQLKKAALSLAIMLRV